MKLWQQQKLARMCSSRNSHSLLVRIMKNVIAILEDWFFFFLLYFFKNKTVPIYDPESAFCDIYLSKVENLHTQENSHANVYWSFIYDDQNFEVTKMSFSRWTDKLIGVQPDNRISFMFSSVQLLSHVWTLCNPMDCSTLGFPVHHQLLELVQTHVHQVGDAIQSSHPLSSPSLPAFNLSQHQGLFQWVSSHQVAKVLVFWLQHQAFLPMNIQDWFL